MDGTLLDTLADLTDGVNYALGVFGCPTRSIGEVRQFVGNGAARLIALALPGTPNDPPADAVLAVFKEYYNDHCRIKTCPYPGILDALEILGREFPMAVVSNKPDSAVTQLCQDYFGSLYARGDRPDCPRKPAPDVVLQTMADIGVNTCIYVGDSEVDVATARNAGVPCLSVTWGFRDQETLIAAGAEHFCDTPAALPGVLRALVSQLEEDHGK